MVQIYWHSSAYLLYSRWDLRRWLLSTRVSPTWLQECFCRNWFQPSASPSTPTFLLMRCITLTQIILMSMDFYLMAENLFFCFLLVFWGVNGKNSPCSPALLFNYVISFRFCYISIHRLICDSWLFCLMLNIQLLCLCLRFMNAPRRWTFSCWFWENCFIPILVM